MTEQRSSNTPALKLCVFNDPYSSQTFSHALPGALRIVIIPGYQQVPRFLQSLMPRYGRSLRAESLAAAHPSLRPLFRRMLSIRTADVSHAARCGRILEFC